MRKIFILIIILAAVVVLGMVSGSVKIPLSDLFLQENRAIISLRFLRIFTAVIAGAGLAVSGVVLQAILRNSLAEPYLLGTSSGAGLGAALSIMMGLSAVFLPVAAFCGAILSIVLVYNLAKQNGKIAEQSLILSGVIVSVAFSAIIVFLLSISSKEMLHSFSWWLWGSLQVFDFKLLCWVSLIVSAGIIAVYLFSQDLNAISLGEEEAIHLGIDIETVKLILIMITALISASLVCVCGIIGFVGLIVPHMMRLVVGPNHKILIPMTIIAAAIFMVACDIISRSVFPPLEIPIGVITAIIGAPIFIFLLKSKQKV